MAGLVRDGGWWPIAAGRLDDTARVGSSARIMAHLLGWPLLVKVGLLSGFAIAAAVQHLFAA